jgi:hypothetical protein
LSRHTLRNAAIAVAVLAPGPYVVLKLMWLSGSTIGTTSAAGASEMHDPRFVVGNLITVALVLTAVGFVIALTRPTALRLPAGLVLVLGAGATGLLAPILLGLPLGLVVQHAVDGALRQADDTGLAPWVFGVVYTGFGLLGAAMAAVVMSYVVERWGDLIAQAPPRPSPLATALGAIGLLPFAAAMTAWGAFGPGTYGPGRMELPAQRTVLVVSGVLALAAFLAPWLRRSARRWARSAWLLTWAGACTAALQAPTHVLLAQGGDVRPVVAAVAVLTTPGAAAYGLGLLRRHLALLDSRPRVPAGESRQFPEGRTAPGPRDVETRGT